MKAQVAELDRVTTTFATTMRERTLQVQGAVSSFGAAIEGSVARLGVMAGGSGTAPAAAPVGGIQLVKVVNDRAAPVPVTIAADLATPLPVTMIAAPKPEGEGAFSSLKGFLSTFSTAITSFVGGFAGEIAAGVTKPFTAVIAGVEMLIFVPMLIGLVKEISGLLETLIGSIRGALDGLFEHLTTAGIFPVTALRDTLLSFVDGALERVTATITPLLGWVEGLLAGVTEWFWSATVALAQYLNQYLNQVTAFLTRYVDFLVERAGQGLHAMLFKAVSAVLGTVLGGLDALGNVLIAAFKYGAALWEHINAQFTHGLTIIANLWLAWKGLPQLRVPEVGPAPQTPEFKGIAGTAMKEGQWAGREMASMLLGEPGAVPKAPKLGRPPVLVQPMLELPVRPGSDAAEGALAPRAAVIGPAPGSTRAAATAGAPAEGGACLTISGGVTVNVRAETLDMQNAEETGRRLAATLLDELDRLVERHAFRRGLVTGAAR